eukprot:3703596-Prymnesium_polylepis.1
MNRHDVKSVVCSTCNHEQSPTSMCEVCGKKRPRSPPECARLRAGHARRGRHAPPRAHPPHPARGQGQRSARTSARCATCTTTT